MAFLAASLKSLTTSAISSVAKRRGGEKVEKSIPLARTTGFNGLSVADIGACPLGWKSVVKHSHDSQNFIRDITNALILATKLCRSNLYLTNRFDLLSI